MLRKRNIFQKPDITARINHDHYLAQGLVGAWLFNEGSGDRVWDLSGHGNHGIFSAGVNWTAGRTGAAVELHGTETIDLGTGLANLTADFTVVIRCRINSDVGGDGGGIVGRFRDGSGPRSTSDYVDWSLLWRGVPGVFRGRHTINGVSYGIDATTNLSIGAWYTLGLVRSGAQSAIYVNGLREGAIEQPGTVDADWPTTYVGNQSPGTAYSADIDVEWLYIYDRAIPDLMPMLHADPYAILEYPTTRYITSNIPLDISHEADVIARATSDAAYASNMSLVYDKYYSANVFMEPFTKFHKLFDTDAVYSIIINPIDDKIIATNYQSPNDTLTLEIGDVLAGGKSGGLWVGRDDSDWRAVEPINLIASAPRHFSNIIRGQTIVLPSIANNTISRVDIYLTEFDISGTEQVDYNLYVELYYADANHKPIGTIGMDYLAQDVISSTDERLRNKDDYYSFDFGNNGFQGTSNRYAIVYRVETTDDKAGFLWWDVSNNKQNNEKLQPYLEGASIISKDGGETWEVLEDYDRTIKVYYPKPDDYEVSPVTFDELFSDTIDDPKVAAIILIDESGSMIS